MRRGTFRPCDEVLDERAIRIGEGHGCLMARIRMSATSGRENSIGGRSPRESISRTLVPESAMWCSLEWGQVFVEAIPSQRWHQKVCS